MFVRDGYSECIGFRGDEIDEFVLTLCTGSSQFLLICFLTLLYLYTNAMNFTVLQCVNNDIIYKYS